MPLRPRSILYALLAASALGALTLRPGPMPATAQDRGAPPDGAADTAPDLTVAQQIGFSDARARLGIRMPMGRGVPAGHVEGEAGGGYLPNPRDGQLTAVTFHTESGPAGASGHATATAKVLYGPKGLAPGIQQVYCFRSEHWLGDGYLRTGQPRPPREMPVRLFNHSWVAKDSPATADVLRRVDYQIDTHDVVMAVGVNNGRSTAVPPLLGSAYNVIAVGSSSGNSSGGGTVVETPGRVKPDLVAPGGQTSFTTPVVAATAAALLEAADRMADDQPDAGRAELIKAVLLAGATQPQGWAPEPPSPLDPHLGAGLVNYFNSLAVMQAGPPSAERITRRYGWRFDQVGAGQTRALILRTTRHLGPGVIALTWHRRIDGRITEVPTDPPRPLWINLPRLADLDLRLIEVPPDAQGEPAGSGTGDAAAAHAAAGDAAPGRVIASSASSIDNVELLRVPHLPPGHYRLEVRRRGDPHDEAWDYALAWRLELAEEPAVAEVRPVGETAPGAEK